MARHVPDIREPYELKPGYEVAYFPNHNEWKAKTVDPVGVRVFERTVPLREAFMYGMVPPHMRSNYESRS